MKNFIKNLQFIFMPSFWVMNKPYDKLHDNALTYLLDTYSNTAIPDSKYEVILGKTVVWWSNYPYGVGIVGQYGYQTTRASRLTIKRLGELRTKLMGTPKEITEQERKDFFKSIV